MANRQATVPVKYTVDPTKPDLDERAALIGEDEDVIARHIEQLWWSGGLAPRGVITHEGANSYVPEHECVVFCSK
jgi:hypothetical protein